MAVNIKKCIGNVKRCREWLKSSKDGVVMIPTPLFRSFVDDIEDSQKSLPGYVEELKKELLINKYGLTEEECLHLLQLKEDAEEAGKMSSITNNDETMAVFDKACDDLSSFEMAHQILPLDV